MWWFGCFLLLASVALALYGLTAYFFWYAIRRKRRRPLSLQNPRLTQEQRRYLEENERAKEYVRALPGKEDWSLQSWDGLALHALYIPAPWPSRRAMVLVHGYGSTGLDEYARFVRFYHELGFHLLLPDNRAHGQSEGKYIGFGWLDRPDLLDWIGRLIARLGADCRIGLHGISMGAAAVMMVGGEADLPEHVRAIVEDCGYTSVHDEFSFQLRHRMRLPVWPILPLTDAYCRCKAGYGFREASALKQVQKIRLPILFIHGEEDDFVPTNMARELYEACPSQAKELYLVPGAAHACAYAQDQAGYEARVRALLQAAGLLQA